MSDLSPNPSRVAALALPVAAVARRLGVAPATLRTWARRYDLGPSEHAAGAHRRYTPADVDRLETMRRLTLAGVAPAEAAQAALAQSRHPESPPTVSSDAGRPGGPGGQVLALPGADGVVRGLGRAAMALDSRTVESMIRSQLAEHGVLHTWDHVLCPVLAAAGARWATTGQGVEVEHLLSDCVTAALREVANQVSPASGNRAVLLASTPQEQHCLPLHAVAAGLAEQSVASSVLGAAMPTSAIEAAVRRTGPAAVFLWSQLPGTADLETLLRLPVTRPANAVIVGGPGWHGVALPDRVSRASDLADAVHQVRRAAGA